MPDGIWQPIETAPKDGTWIIVTTPHAEDEDPLESNEPDCCIVRWAADIHGDGWAWETAWADQALNTTLPTHWMPLPPPPHTKEGEG